MTTFTMNRSAVFFNRMRAPRQSFAARLAAMQARHEQDEAASGSFATGVAVRAVLALVPFTALAWVFVTV